MQPARPGVMDVLRPMAFFLVITGSAACGTPATPLPSVPLESVPPATLTASIPVTASPSEEPTDSPSIPATPSSAPPSVTSSPNITPTPTPGGDGTASACSGSSQTKDFFTAIAEAVQWPVYCAVLPSGWSVDRGSGNTYALANGGRMVIGYHSNAGLHLELREGHWCTDSASSCSQHDQDLGPITIGDLQGELMTGSGGFVVYVDPGESPSWTFTGTGMDEGAFRNLIGNLALVRA